jgi:hypothetical protein
MTVIIHAPGGDMRALAATAVDSFIKEAGNPSYDTDLRQQAIEAIVDYRPAYVRMSDYSDQLSTNAAIWAMGGKLGVTSLDPVAPLFGLRAVAKHMEALWPDMADIKIEKALRNIAPANAMALLDRQLLLEERGIREADVDWSNAAALSRARQNTTKTMVSGAQS